MKKLLVLLVALLLVVSSTAFAEKVELEMNYWMSEQETGIQAAIDAFNASQDEIQVNASTVPWGDRPAGRLRSGYLLHQRAERARLCQERIPAGHHGSV